MRTPNRPISSMLKVVVVTGVLGAVALLTHEPGAVAGAFAATVAALYHRQPARRCVSR